MTGMAGDDELVEIRIRLKDARQFVTDAKGVSRHVDDIGDKSERTGRRMKAASMAARGFGFGIGAMAKAAKYGAIALGIGLAGAMATGLTNFAAAEKVMAQTNAVIRSTGGAANLTARQISSLATVTAMKTGIDDEAIQAGQNLLLTFTQVQDKVGKGNKVFTDATALMADLSVALGQDATQSAVQLGKALNDPARGITALRKVGVTFTQQQIDQVKALQKSGDLLGAQKLVMAELRKEFGGSAEAYGKTLAGSMERAKIIAGNLSEALGGALAPSLKRGVDLAARFGRIVETQMGRGASPVDALTTAIGRMFGWQSKAMDLWKRGRAIAGKLWDMIGVGIAKVREIAPHIVAFGKSILDGLKPAQPFIENIIVPLFKGLAIGIIGSLVGAWKVVWPVLSALFKVLGWIGTKAKPFKGAIEGIGKVLGFVFGGPILKGIGLLGKMGGVLGFIGKIAGMAGGFVLGFGRVIGKVVGWYVKGLSFLFKLWAGTWKGIGAVALMAGRLILSNVKGAMTKVLGFITKLGSKFLGAGKGLWGKLVKGMKDAFGSGAGFVKDVAGRFVAFIAKQLNQAIPNKLGPINLPNNPISVPGFAGGGVLRSGTGIVGEHRPESITTLPGGGVRIDPLPTRLANRVRARMPDPFAGLSPLPAGGAVDEGGAPVWEVHVYIDGEKVSTKLARVVKRKAARR